MTGVLVERMVSGNGYEAILGIHRDETFGHIVTFGAGGVFVEIADDHQRRMLPLDFGRAQRLVASSRLSVLLAGHRGAGAVATDDLAKTLVSVSNYVVEKQEAIDQLEINPLWISSGGEVVALDALLILRESNV
jgi:succinyl-CoA synthetase beta subunit